MPKTAPARPAVARAAAPDPDRSTVRLALFVGGLVVMLIAGFGLGRVVGQPAGDSTGGTGTAGATADHTHAPGTGDHTHPPASGGAHDHSTGGPATGPDGVSGLSLSSAGYTLVPATTRLEVGPAVDFRFTVQAIDRQTVTTFAVVHDKPLHLIVLRRDLTGYQHLHPTMAPDGTWSVPLALTGPGIWRAYADFTAVDTAGTQTPVTLGVDLVAGGDYQPTPLPSPAREANVDDFVVTYEGTPQVGATQPLQFRVFRAGSPVAGLERYLGAYGHLVAVRDGDLGYVHVHPEPELASGAIKFWLTAPSPGRYRLFLDFQVAGQVHTAEFTLVVG
ncbi:hypothetical protein AB0I61_00770 [Polymorphospora rubra]|uniref:hypothetical protein n=1 Tax=Polymorphospora rubra TaxID=338584 RepID=UPI0033E58CBF